MKRQLRGHPQRARSSGEIHFLRANLVLERRRKASLLPFRNAVRKKTPKFQSGFRLVRAVQHRLFDIQVVARAVNQLAAKTGNVVWMREMKIIIDHKSRRRNFLRKCIARIDSEHQIWRVIRPPRTRVFKVVLGVERVVPNQAAEEPCLHR